MRLSSEARVRLEHELYLGGQMRNLLFYDLPGTPPQNKTLVTPPVGTAHINKAMNNYPPSCTIVVQVHERSCISLLLLLGINKRLGELDGMVNMVTTATPIKGPFGIM